MQLTNEENRYSVQRVIMNFKKLLLSKTSQVGRLWWILVVLMSIFYESTVGQQYTDACRSIHGKLGTCVPLASCPLFYGWLKVRPLVKENLRLLVKYTCFFDTRNPKVCCPNDSLYGQEFSDDTSFRLATPIRRAVGTGDSPHPANKLHFPDSFPPTSHTSSKGHHRDTETPQLSSVESHKREFIPLSFPTERPQHQNGHSQQNERGGMSSVWNGNKNNKDVTSSRKDLRLHPNFRLIPQLHECSNAIKLDSLSGTYGVYPWIALVGLKRRRSLDFDHVCAGAIINNRYILTSAHCFERRAKPRNVRLGEYNLDTLIDQGSDFLPQSRREDYQIDKLLVHEDYNAKTGANDIALIRVDRPIALNTTFIKSVCLPFASEYGVEDRLDVSANLDGKSAWVAGWSRHSWDGLYQTGAESSVLQEGVVQFTTHERCRQDHPILSPFSSRTQLCVGGKGRRNSCVPDSGGPLMYPIKVPSRIEGFVEPKFFLLGLLSHGPTGNVCQIANIHEDDEEKKEEASRLLPTSVYIRVSKYLSWILDNMKD